MYPLSARRGGTRSSNTSDRSEYKDLEINSVGGALHKYAFFADFTI